MQNLDWDPNGLGRIGAWLLAIAVLSVPSAQAIVTGSISGAVKDPSGGVVPTAEVTVLNVDTGVRQTVKTDDLGGYAFLALAVGNYTLSIQAAGFEKFEQTNITLTDNDKLRFDITLRVGLVTEQVQVAATAVHVETASTQLGDVIQSRAIESLPLNGREFTDLLGLQPGVVPEFTTTQSNFFGSTANGNLSISGQREAANGFFVNGGNVDDAINNGTTVTPNIDAISEFRVLTANFDPEYGNYSGGIVTVVTKSGSNQLHGDGFEFLRNDDMDSRNFYQYNGVDPLTHEQIPGSARGRFQQNQFGGTLGGPIRHDKVFFFADYQGTRTIQAQPTGLVLVPSAAERSGDFSAAATSLTGTVDGSYFAGLLSQELGYPVTSGEHYYTAGCAASSQCVFPSAIVPNPAFTAPSMALLKDIPLPTEGPYFTSSANNVSTQDDLASMRVDGQSDRFGMLSAYYFIDENSNLTPFGGFSVPGFPTLGGGRSQLIILGDTKSFGGNALNELRVNFNRLVFHKGYPVGNYPVSLSSLGFAEGQVGGINAAYPQLEGVPYIGFNNFAFGLPDETFNRYEDTPSGLDNFSLVKATHTFKFGAQYTFNDFYEPLPLLGGNGSFSFTGTETGIDFADYLIGAPTSFGQEGSVFVDNRRNYMGLYAQDSWRARHSFTVNYGLRWDMIEPWYEKRLQSSTLVSGVTSTVYPGAPTGYVFPGDKVPGFGTIPSTISPTPYTNFAPRIGFAYSPSGPKWLTGGAGSFSIRSGFGMFYTNIEGAAMLDETGLDPFSIYYGSPAPPLFVKPLTNRTDGATHFDAFPYTPPARGSTSAAFWNPLLPLAVYPTPEITDKTPYSENYNFTVQRQFGQSTLLSLGYVGSQGHHLMNALDNNPGNPQLCLSLSQPQNVAAGSPTCGPFGENTVYTSANGTVINGTRAPFGIDYGTALWFATLANSSYNALQVSLRHTTKRLAFFAAYTFSKSLDNTSSIWNQYPDPYNTRLSRGLSSFDATQDLTVSYSYLLPFDRLAGGRRPRLASGWQLVGITRFSTGFPIGLSESDDRSLLGHSGIDRPDFSGGNLSFTNPRTGQPYFNTSLFTREQLGYLGTADSRFFHGPGINNWDLSLQKEVNLTESKKLQFRGELFNGFNHAQFLNPSGNVNSGAFALVTSAAPPRIAQVAMKFLF